MSVKSKIIAVKRAQKIVLREQSKTYRMCASENFDNYDNPEGHELYYEGCDNTYIKIESALSEYLEELESKLK